MRRLLLLALAVTAAISILGAISWDRGQAMHAEPEPAESLDGDGVLDGMTFSGVLGPSGQEPNVEDIWIFDRGLFVSMECLRRCDYPARPYFFRGQGDAIEFVSETECPDKDAKIYWRGTIEGETIQGEFTWIVDRWYWTIEKTFHFEGELAEQALPLARK